MTRIVLPSLMLLLLLPTMGAAQETYEDYLKLGDQHWKAQKPDKAILAFTEALTKNPKGAAAHRGLGRVYRFQKAWGLAIKHLREAVRLGPKDGLNHFWLGVTYEQDPDYRAQAIEHLQKAIGLLPPTATVQKLNLRALAYNRIGRMEMLRKNHAAARKAYLAAHRILPDNLPPLQNLAKMAHQSGRFSEARTWYEKLLQLRPKDKRLQATLRSIRKKQSVFKIEIRILVSELMAGQTLTADQISFRGYDKKKRIVDFDQHWEVSSGLEIVKTNPLTIKAKDQPSKEEWVYLTDNKSGVFGKAALSISGRPVKLEITPEQLTAYPAQKPVFKLEVLDSAGNRLAPNMADWQIKLDDKVLQWDVHKIRERHYRISIPRDAQLGKYRIRASSSKLVVVTELRITNAASGDSSLISWADTLEDALAKGRKEDTPIVLYFWAMDSPPCDRMDAETWLDSKVRQTLGRLSRVKLNAANHPSLLLRYRIRAIPALVFFSPSGIYLTRHSNYVGPRELHLTLLGLNRRTEKAKAELTKLEAAVQANPNKPGSLIALAEFHRNHFNNEKSKTAYRKALEVGPSDAEQSQCRLQLAYFLIRERDFEEAEELVEKVIGTAKDPVAQSNAQYYLGYCQYYGRQEQQKARATWKALIQKYPKTNGATKARRMLRTKFGD